MGLKAKVAADALTITRPDGITYFDKNGTLQQSAVDEMVKDHQYDPNSGLWVPRGWPIFTERTNFLTYSSNFNQWNIEDGTYSNNTITASTNNARLYDYVTLATAGNHVAWLDLEENTTNWAAVRLTQFDESHTVYFDLSTGVVGTESLNAVGDIVEIEPGIYRCSISFNTSDLSGLIFVNPVDNDGSMNATSGASIKIYRGQVENGNYPGPYIPTNGTALTRAGDTLKLHSYPSQPYWSGDGFTIFVDIEQAQEGGNVMATGGHANYYKVYRTDGTRFRYFTYVNGRLSTIHVYNNIPAGPYPMRVKAAFGSNMEYSRLVTKDPTDTIIPKEFTGQIRFENPTDDFRIFENHAGWIRSMEIHPRLASESVMSAKLNNM